MTQQEFEHIYIAVKGDLMRLAGKFCRSAAVDLDAEDVAQEALITFWELAERGYPMPNPKALLVKITKNICISRYRKRKLETEPMTGADFIGGENAAVTVEMADEQLIKQRLYDTLTRTERLYMQMKSEEGMSLDEMVQETGVSRASVKMALSKAKKKLEEQLKKMGYGICAALLLVMMFLGKAVKTWNSVNSYAEITTVELMETISVLTDNNLDEINCINARPGRKGIVVTAEFKNGITRTYLMKRGADGSSIEMTAQNSK